MASERKPLAGILPGNSLIEDIFDRFETAEAADEFGPLPKGTYLAVAISVEMSEAKTGNKGYKIGFRVTEGDHLNRRLWRTWYFTDSAMAYTKRDLAKFGITGKAQLQQAFPRDRFVCKLFVTERKLDDGTKANEIKSFEIVRVQEPEVNPFAPQETESEGGDS